MPPDVIEAYTTRGGGPQVTTSTTIAYTADYQCVTAHGHETVSDATTKTVVTYEPGMAILGPYNYGKKGFVHVPIHNPPQMIKTLTLQNIYLNFDNNDDAKIKEVDLYYDKVKKKDFEMDRGKTFTIDLDLKESQMAAYEVPTGISVMITCSFPRPGSYIRLYSVTLVYKTAT